MESSVWQVRIRRWTLTVLCAAALLKVLKVPTQATACTALGITPGATEDGSAYTTTTADCKDCDFRLARVPSRVHAAGSLRPINVVKSDYPHEISERSSTWHPQNLEGSETQISEWKKFASEKQIVGYIPEISRTYALFEGGGGYSLINEKMVSIGESTCPGRFVARPRNDGGHALFDVGALSKVALERASSAREALLIMGELAENYGYYGAEYGTNYEYFEAGEALTVADKKEVWMFHILPDDTGRSAVWAAQRVPDGTVVAVANFFVIRNITSGSEDFMHSKNIYEVSKRSCGWKPTEENGGVLDFAKTFSKVRPHPSYSTLRVWRVFTLLNPSLKGVLNEHPNIFMDGYPFSVKPKRKLSVKDVFSLNRDHYDGSKYDLTKGLAAGPYGDPDRYDAAAEGGMSRRRAFAGSFGRAISLFRTSYTSIARSNAKLPDQVGSLLYFSQQQPDSSVFIPLYVAIPSVPETLSNGNLFRYSKNSTFWAVTLVSNWVHRYYMHAISSLRDVQQQLEGYDVDQIDKRAAQLIQEGRGKEAIRLMSAFSAGVAKDVHTRYTDFFLKLVARFHDGYRMSDANSVRVNMTSFFYPEHWLMRVGYFTKDETTNGSMELHTKKVAPPANFTEIGVALNFGIGVVVGAALCIALVYTCTDLFKSPSRRRAGYAPIPDANVRAMRSQSE